MGFPCSGLLIYIVAANNIIISNADFFNKEVCVAYDDVICGYDIDKQTRTWKTHFFPKESLQSARNPNGKRLVFDASENPDTGLVVAALSDGTIGMVDSR